MGAEQRTHRELASSCWETNVFLFMSHSQDLEEEPERVRDLSSAVITVLTCKVLNFECHLTLKSGWRAALNTKTCLPSQLTRSEGFSELIDIVHHSFLRTPADSVLYMKYAVKRASIKKKKHTHTLDFSKVYFWLPLEKKMHFARRTPREQNLKSRTKVLPFLTCNKLQ